MARKGAHWTVVKTGVMSGVKQAIRDELDRRDWTQKELAGRCGLSEKHTSQLLNGRVLGSLEALAAMATACGLRIEARRAGDDDLLQAQLSAGDRVAREILEAACAKAGLSLDSTVDPGQPARNYELADRLGVGHVFFRDGGQYLPPGVTNSAPGGIT